jgi:transcriptional regulator with XRE-family HTH domain
MVADNPWFLGKSPDQESPPETELRYRLHQLREAAGLDIKELATLADVAPGDIRCIEAGEYSPPLFVLQNLAIALKIPVEELTKCRHPGFKPEAVTNL